ncbi:2OG-Fe(II) oxygenase [Thalassotalea marina]|uniref:Prolyl 4-hydroxylase subunit alpha n=1 Tax=Thalassotalea marina TaxID=1673741 RepID=A0A919EFR7_9GAMM|nr:2OG-Fe(II) oxygenase [Thalassotalea marina]GHF77078.1 prolyl 4-hydroxylase subunit alpha [Thalassotalea marina]
MTDFIEIYPQTLTPEFCQQFIASFEQSPHKTAGRTGGGVDESKKISQDIYLNQHPEFQQSLNTITQACTNRLLEYINKYYFSLISSISLTLEHPVTKKPVQLTQENFEEVAKPNLFNLVRYLFRLAPINAQKYNKQQGNYQYWHSEIFPQPGHNDALHRVLLFIIYLNDVAEGGETDFFYQEKSIKPEAGTMIIAPCGFTHTHRGNIPISNDKYVLTSWMLYNPAQQIYTS